MIRNKIALKLNKIVDETTGPHQSDFLNVFIDNFNSYSSLEVYSELVTAERGTNRNVSCNQPFDRCLERLG